MRNIYIGPDWLMTVGFKPLLDFFSAERMSARSSHGIDHELGGENTKGPP